MHSQSGIRKVRRSGLKAIQTYGLGLSNIYERETDSGVDESSEEDIPYSTCGSPTTKDSPDNEPDAMRGYDCELDKNIEQLEEEIIRYCDNVIKSVERRKHTLLGYVQNIRNEKLKSLQKTQQQRFNSDMFKSDFNYRNDVNSGSCLRFLANDQLIGMIQEFGKIDEGRAAAEKSKVFGIGLKYGIANEPTQFELQTHNTAGELSWVEQDKIEVTIKRDNKTFPCVVQNKCNGIYDIFYELQFPGLYEIHVQVNSRHIKESPFVCHIFEKCNLKFLYTDERQPEWTIQNGDKSVLVDKTEIQRTSKLYSNVFSPTKAWKVRVTTACSKIKLKFGYANKSTGIPDLYEEFYCKFDLSELMTGQQETNHYHYHHTYHQHNRRHRSKKTMERKQSTFHRSSLTFLIVQDSDEQKVHVGLEGTAHTKTTFLKDSDDLVPFIGIKHFCKNANCPRPMLVFV